MPHTLLLQRIRIGITLTLTCLLTGLVIACGGNKPPITITFWSWVPNLQQDVELFNQSHSDIRVELQNVGGGLAEYTKLSTALRDHASPPDVAQIEYLYLPEYEQNQWLVDLSSYGANNLKSSFVGWAWDQVSQGSKVYAVPQDSGVMGLLYRNDIFQKYGLEPPTTWDQYSQDAMKLHELNPSIKMTNFEADDGTWFLSLAGQAGSQPFKSSGNNRTINLDDAPAIQVANYWENLLKFGAVSKSQDRTPEWYTELDNTALDDKPTIASWITGAWALTELKQYATKSAGKWMVASLPQWTPERTPGALSVSATWGGSTDAVMAQSQHPEPAFEFIKWLNTNEQSVTKLTNDLYLFPTQQSELSNPSFFDYKNSFYGRQTANKVFVNSPLPVKIPSLGSPFENFVVAQLQSQLTEALSKGITLQQALDNTQNTVVLYARQPQG